MLNIIRADLYRILRGKGFYITAFLLILYIVLQVAANSTGGVMVTSSSMVAYTDADGTVHYSYEQPIFTGSLAPIKMIENADVMLYFLLPFIIFIAAADFSTDAVKNVLSNGMSRIKYYLSKLILSCIFCFLVLITQVIVSMITGTILRGFGGDFNIEFIGQILRPFSAQLVMFIAVTCIGIFLVFATKRTAAVNGAYIAFCMLPLLIMLILYQFNDKLEFLMDYDIVMNIRLLAGIDTAASGDIVRAFAIGGFYILASTIGGIMLFKRSEVK